MVSYFLIQKTTDESKVNNHTETPAVKETVEEKQKIATVKVST